MDMSTRVGSTGLALPKGITPAGTGKAGQTQEVVWSILGHTYWLKAEYDGCFIFETLDPPGTFVPPHIHPTQDEFNLHAGGYVRSLSRRNMDASQARRPCAHAQRPASWLLQQARQ